MRNYLAAVGAAASLSTLKFNCATGLMSSAADAEESVRLPLFTNTNNNKIIISGIKKQANTMMMSCFGDLIRLPCSLLIRIYRLTSIRDILSRL